MHDNSSYSRSSPGKKGKLISAFLVLLVLAFLTFFLVGNPFGEAKEQVKVYNQLESDLQQDSVELEWRYFLAHENTAMLSNILRVINNDYTFDPDKVIAFKRDETEIIDTAAFIMSISRASSLEFPQLTDASYTRLKNNGKIALLENELLRNEIGAYYKGLDTYEYLSDGYRQTTSDLSEIIQRLLGFRPSLSANQNLGELYLAVPRLPEIIDAMKQEEDLEVLCREMTLWQRQLVISLDSRKNSATRLLSIIRLEKQRVL